MTPSLSIVHLMKNINLSYMPSYMWYIDAVFIPKRLWMKMMGLIIG